MPIELLPCCPQYGSVTAPRPTDARGSANTELCSARQVRVVRGEHERAGVGGERGLEPLDRRQVEVVGRLVQHQQPGAPREAERERELARLARRGLLGLEQTARLDAERGDQREQPAALLGAERARLVEQRALLGALELLRQHQQPLARDARRRARARAAASSCPSRWAAASQIRAPRANGEVDVFEDARAGPARSARSCTTASSGARAGSQSTNSCAPDLLLELDLGELRARALEHACGCARSRGRAGSPRERRRVCLKRPRASLSWMLFMCLLVRMRAFACACSVRRSPMRRSSARVGVAQAREWRARSVAPRRRARSRARPSSRRGTLRAPPCATRTVSPQSASSSSRSCETSTPTPAKRAQRRDQQRARLRVEVVGRLVEHQAVRLARERRADLPALALAGRERRPARERRPGRARARRGSGARRRPVSRRTRRARRPTPRPAAERARTSSPTRLVHDPALPRARARPRAGAAAWSCRSRWRRPRRSSRRRSAARPRGRAARNRDRRTRRGRRRRAWSELPWPRANPRAVGVGGPSDDSTQEL